MSSELQNVYTWGAVIHLAAAVVFIVWFLVSVFQPRPKQQSVLVSASLVVLVTQSVYWAQSVGVGQVMRADGRVLFVAEWLGYAFSLNLIGRSLALFLGLEESAQFVAGFSLFLVGLGGVLGLFVDSEFPGAQWAVALGVTGLYVLYFVYVIARGSRWSNIEWLTVIYFAFATLTFYVFPYIAGPPVTGGITAELEHIFYLIGNVLTKIVLPAWEAAIILG